MKEMRKRLKKQEKKENHKTLYMAHCLEYNLPYDVEEEALVFKNESTFLEIDCMAKSSDEKKKDKDEEVVLPVRLTLGVTLALAGYFLYNIPIPICETAGSVLFSMGMGYLIDVSITEWEDRQEENKNKKQLFCA